MWLPVPDFRFKAKYITCFDIRGIGYNEVKEWGAGEGGQQIGTEQMNSFIQIVKGNIFAGHFKGVLGKITGYDLAVGKFFGHDNGNGSATGTEIQDILRLFAWVVLKGRKTMLKEELGFRAGDQDGRADKKIKGPEFTAADNILQGFALASSLE